MGIISLASGSSCWRGLDYYKEKRVVELNKILVELVIEELNKKFKRNKIDTLTRDSLLKNIDNIIIFQNGKINIEFR